jgi:D-glycero-D-manno-heptose 1,7-bisphosphate phosphatase
MSLSAHASVRAVLIDRDDMMLLGAGGESGLGEPTPGAKRAVHALREAGLRVGVVADRASSPSDAISAERLADVLGPFDVWCDCAEHTVASHSEAVRRAADLLSLDPGELVVIGGTGADVEAARACGAASILVADAVTTSLDVEDADVVVDSIADAAALVLHSLRPVRQAHRAG